MLVTLGLAAWGAALWHWRPASPVEWDEVLFLRALERYDVALHTPHPPGYPLYVAFGHIARLLLADPVQALQLVSVLAAVACVAVVYLWPRRAGVPWTGAAAAATVAATVPTVAFHAAAGFSDLPGVALALVAAWLFAESIDRPPWLPLAGLAAAAALGVRPQLVVTLVPVGLWAIAGALRRGAWRWLIAGFAVGGLGTVACWLPAILLTGPGRFREALEYTLTFVARREAPLRLPAAPLTEVVRCWLIDPFATWWLAVAFAALALAGGVLLWRHGTRRLAALAAATFATYLLAATTSMNYPEAIRYSLPAWPFAAILVAGVATAADRIVRRVLAAGVVTWCIVAAGWIVPAMELRRRERAPAWACIDAVLAAAAPSRSLVVYDGDLMPHVAYRLKPGGFRLEEWRPGVPYATALPGGEVLYLGRVTWPGGTPLLARRWEARGLEALSREVYRACRLVRADPAASVQFSSEFAAGADGVSVRGRGQVSVPAGVPPQLVRVVAGPAPLRLQSAAVTVDVEARGEGFIVVDPDRDRRLFVGGSMPAVPIPGLELIPIGREDLAWATGGPPDRELWVPAAAHVKGRFETFWVTDVLLRNPHPFPLDVHVRFAPYPTSGPGGDATITIPPEGVVWRSDLVATVAAGRGGGAVRLVADRPFFALWRTWPRSLPPSLDEPRLRRCVAPERAVTRAEMAPLVFRPGREGARVTVAFINPGSDATEVAVRLRDAAGGLLFADRVTVAAGGAVLLDTDRLLGARSRTTAFDASLDFTAADPVIPVVTAIESGPNRPTYTVLGSGATRLVAPSTAPQGRREEP